MKADEIREKFLQYFEERGHLRRSSASLVPSVHDPSVLLTTAGMQPLRPYFLGQETPPGPRLTTCQRCFRTTDIEEVGNTARHLTFFEMLGNFSFGDYFKHDAIRFGWELSTEGFGFDPDQIWVTVFEGDDELGLGPDTEAIEIWREIGVPEERIVRLPRAENWWQAGPTGPAGPCSEMYLDRGERFGRSEDLPGDDTERFLEYWNHVFMTYELHEDGSLTDLPSRNIDTGLGLERMAAIKQDVPSVYETDLFRPLVELAEELSGRSYGDDGKGTRAMRIIADHTRGTANLIADGVVPSNEDRGYILRRIMRRAIQQGRVLGLEPPYLGRFAERVIEDMGGVYPHLVQHRDTILRWVSDEEESFGRTLARGTALLHELVEDAARQGTSWVDAAEAFKLHDTYGFPYDLTRELLAEEGLSVDDAGFEALMEKQRIRARTGAEVTTPDRHTEVISFVSAAPETRFVGYETLRATTSVAASEGANGASLVKLEESPFYAEGGGQVADSGRIRWDEAEALGAIALFGEKYGEWVRVVEVEDVSRELCGGTHVANTAEVGIFGIVSEGSSATNVRRVEALTGPAAIDWFRDRSRQLEEAGALLGSPRDPVAAARRAGARLEELEADARQASTRQAGELARELAERESTQIDGLSIVVAPADRGADQRALLELADRVRSLAGDAAVVLGGSDRDRVALVAAFADAAVERGLSAAEVVREAAEVVGGGGGGRPNVAQAGGRDASRLDEALETARRAIERQLST